MIVTLSEIKEVLGISSSDIDDYLEILGETATQFIADYCNVAFEQEERTIYLSGWTKVLWLKSTPIISITSVTDVDTSQVLNSTDYRLVQGTCRLVQYDYSRWPEGDGRWKVIYLSGYTAGNGYDIPSTIPVQLKQACLSLIKRRYDTIGDKSMQSVFGYNVTWREFAESDTIKLLNRYKIGFGDIL